VRAKVRCVCCVVSFPKFHYNDLLPTCCGLVGRVANAQNPLHTFPRSFLVDEEVANLLLATNRCNGIWETTRHNRHNGLFAHADLLQTCYREVANLLRGETGVMEFCLNKSVTSPSTGKLRGNVCNGIWAVYTATGAVGFGARSQLVMFDAVSRMHYGNAVVRPVLASIHRLPWAADAQFRVGQILCETFWPPHYLDGAPQSACPRYQMKKNVHSKIKQES